MRAQEALHLVMIANHVEIKQPARCGEDQSLIQSSTAFVETTSQSANSRSAVRVRITKRGADVFDQVSDFFALGLGEPSQVGEQVRIKLYL
jgi:hypothetical protein